LTSTRLRLDTFQEPDGVAPLRRPLGYAILETPSAGTPFHVVERYPNDPQDAGDLVTFSEPGDDDVFLREGYTLYY